MSVSQRFRRFRRHRENRRTGCGFGFARYPEEKIREEIATGELKVFRYKEAATCMVKSTSCLPTLRAQDPGLDVWRKFYARTCAANPTNLAHSEGMGRLLFRSVEGNGSWSAQIDRRESEPAEVSPEIIDSVRDWYQALCRHTFLRRAANDAHLALTLPLEAYCTVTGGSIGSKRGLGSLGKSRSGCRCTACGPPRVQRNSEP